MRDKVTDRAMPVTIEIPLSPTDEDREAILKALAAFNERMAGASNYAPLAINIRDQATSERLGGLWAQIYYGWLFVELLYVPELNRGQGLGSRLLAEAERIAREKGCKSVWLETFRFQAPGFYRKLGYEPFGVLTDYPKGQSRLFFQKSLASCG
jgi:GNAT superfamily N-acetyltransferase